LEELKVDEQLCITMLRITSTVQQKPLAVNHKGVDKWQAR